VTTQTSAWQGDPGTARAVPGTVIGDRYELRSTIGNGGMGTVWQAVDLVLRRDVAVKEVLLPPGMPPGERTAMYERTLREGRAAAALSHPSVVQVYDVVTDGGRPWIVMELLQARSLSEIIIADGPIAGRAVAKIGIALLGALEVAHVAGVLHRDVKPANVLICGDGRCVLTDFGVARMPSESNLTQPGMVLGSPHFISPERAIGAAFGPPSDLFSLGVTLYTAIEGRPPFDRGDPFETMRAIVEEEPLPPVRAGVLAPVLMGLLEKDPQQRWTVPEARTALRELTSSSLGRSNPRPAPTYTPPLPTQRPAPAAPPRTPAPPLAPDDDPIGPLGGRAMLADGESIEERLRRRQTDTGSYLPAIYDASALDDSRTPAESTGAMRPPAGSGPAPAGRMGMATDAARGVLSAVRSWSRRTQALVAGGVVAILVIAGILIATSGPSTPSQPTAHTATTGSPSPSFAVTAFHDSRGITVDVPADWKKSTGGSYTDFTDPKDDSRRVRINVEASGSDSPLHFLEVAERGLKNPSRCTAPYQRIALKSIKLGTRDAAELEYTCGSGTGKRHGIWAATTSGGHAYHFYLSVPDSEFEQSVPIFNEMVSTFQLTTSSN
jgi:serine/threonine protein kinase